MKDSPIKTLTQKFEKKTLSHDSVCQCLFFQLNACIMLQDSLHIFLCPPWLRSAQQLKGQSSGVQGAKPLPDPHHPNPTPSGLRQLYLAKFSKLLVLPGYKHGDIFIVILFCIQFIILDLVQHTDPITERTELETSVKAHTAVPQCWPPQTLHTLSFQTNWF